MPDQTDQHAEEDRVQMMMDGYAAVVLEQLNKRLATLSGLRHEYEKTPGEAFSVAVVDGEEIVLNRLQEVLFDNLTAEGAETKLVKAADALFVAISADVNGKALLVTRHPASSAYPPSRTGYADGFGLRVVVKLREPAKAMFDFFVQCLYGTA